MNLKSSNLIGQLQLGMVELKLNNLIFIESGCGHNEIKWRLSNMRGAEPLNVLHSSSYYQL